MRFILGAILGFGLGKLGYPFLLVLVRAAYCSSQVPWILLRNEVGYPQKYSNKMGVQPDLGTSKGDIYYRCPSSGSRAEASADRPNEWYFVSFFSRE